MSFVTMFEFPSLNLPPNWPTVIVGMQWECVSGSVQMLGARSRSPARGVMCPGAWVRLGSSVPRQELRQWQALDRTRWCLSFYFCFLYLLLFFNLFIHSILVIILFALQVSKAFALRFLGCVFNSTVFIHSCI